MPWIKATKPPAEVPAHYEWPITERAVSFLNKDIEKAVERRRYWTQQRETMLQYQKDDREAARFFSQEAKDALKHQRAWQFTVDFLAGKPEIYRYAPPTSEEIAPYIDGAFSELVFGQPQPNIFL